MSKGALFFRAVGAWCVAIVCCARCAAQTSQAGDRQAPQQAANIARPKEYTTQADSADESAVGQQAPVTDNALGMALIKNLARDQRAIWTSPAHLRLGDATWLVPFVGLTAGFLVTDRAASLHLSNSPTTLRHYTSFSNYGLAGMAGASADLYLLGKATNEVHKRETGLRSGAARRPWMAYLSQPRLVMPQAESAPASILFGANSGKAATPFPRPTRPRPGPSLASSVTSIPDHSQK
jgi:hypothetical protein